MVVNPSIHPPALSFLSQPNFHPSHSADRKKINWITTKIEHIRSVSSNKKLSGNNEYSG